jgi:acetylornithine/succinyldiaminopimelate/putrescine aminotransferase
MTNDNLHGNLELGTLLRNAANPIQSPGAVAVSGVVAAFAAAIGDAGDTDQKDHSWPGRVKAALISSDDDTRAYWGGDSRGLMETPLAVQAEAIDVARTSGRIRSGNHADLDASTILAIGATAAVSRVIEQNQSPQSEAITPQAALLAPASKPDQSPLLVVSRASGPYLTDESGDEWFDAASGMWNVPLGHGDPIVISAWLSQAIQVAAIDPFLASTSIAERTARQLLEIVGVTNGRVIFASSGSESIEAALRFGLHLSPGASVWSMPGAFHGATAGAAALSAYPTIWGPLPERALWSTSAHPSEWLSPGIGFVEPIQIGRGGLSISENEVNSINDFQRRGGIVIADEVACGLGRAVWPVAAPTIGLDPDMYVLGKGLTNGVASVSALVISEHVADALQSRGALDFGHTHSNHPAGLAAAAATLSSLSTVNHSEQHQILVSAFRALGVPLKGTGFLLTSPGSPVSRERLMQALSTVRLVSHSPTTASTIDQITIAPPITITEVEAADLASRVLAVRRILSW